MISIQFFHRSRLFRWDLGLRERERIQSSLSDRKKSSAGSNGKRNAGRRKRRKRKVLRMTICSHDEITCRSNNKSCSLEKCLFGIFGAIENRIIICKFVLSKKGLVEFCRFRTLFIKKIQCRIRSGKCCRHHFFLSIILFNI